MSRIFQYIRVGLDGRLLARNLEHYRTLGVERVLLDVNLRADEGDDLLDQVRKVAQEFDAVIAGCYRGPMELADKRRPLILPQYCADDDWVVICDLDEFQEYPCGLRDLASYCEHRSYDYVHGRLLDRVAADGSFPGLQEGSLWDQFPIGVRLTANKRGGDTRKIVFTRPWVRVTDGNHEALNGQGMPEGRFCSTVHHFKWDAGVVERSRFVMHMEQSEDRHWWWELERLLDFLELNEGRIDLSDPGLGAFRPGYRRTRAAGAWQEDLYFENHDNLPWLLKPRHVVPVRRPGVRVREVEGNPVLARAGRAEALAVNAPVLAVWSLCDGCRTVNDIVDHLQTVLEVHPGDVRRDVTDVLDSLSGDHGCILAKDCGSPSR